MRTRSLILGLAAMVFTASAAEMYTAPNAGSNGYNNATVMGATGSASALGSDKGLTNVNLKGPVPMAANQSQKAGGSHYRFRVGGTNQPSSVTDIKSELADAIARVKEIVNQPVEGLPRKPSMTVATASPGWFRPGAPKPDFNRVDIRNTQVFPYERYEYVTSDPNPNVVYSGPELEYNPMTKYFYLDWSVPKKKLNESEMLEVNRLYRIIGQDERRLAGLQTNDSGR